MADITKQRFDVTTATGIVFKDLRFSKLKELIDDRTLRPDDLVLVHGLESEGQLPLSRLQGVSFPEEELVSFDPVPNTPWAVDEASSKSGMAGLGSGTVWLVFMGIAALVSISGYVWFFSSSSGESPPSAMVVGEEPPAVVVVAEEPPSADHISVDYLESHKDFLALQSRIGSDLHEGIKRWWDSLGESREDSRRNLDIYLDSTKESQTRKELRGMLSSLSVIAATEFKEAYLSFSDVQDLSRLAVRNGIMRDEALLDWLIAEVLMDHGLMYEIWLHEAEVSNEGVDGISAIDKALISRISLLGKSTRPELKDGAQHIDETESSYSYRIFRGSIEIAIMDSAGGKRLSETSLGTQAGSGELILESDLILLRNLAYGFEAKGALQLNQRLVRCSHEAGRWRGFWGDSIRAYVKRLEGTGWGQESLVSGQISRTNLISDEDVIQNSQEMISSVSGELDQDAWVENYGRSIPLIITDTASGTGFLVEDKEGKRLYLVTNRHCIDGQSWPYSYAPAAEKISIWHMTVDVDGEITGKYDYSLSPSDFKVHRDGVDIAVADVTARRPDFEESSIYPLPMTSEVPGRGDELFWVGHPNSFEEPDSEGLSESEFYQQDLDLLKLTEGPLNLSKKIPADQVMEHWNQGETKMLYVESSMVAGNSGGPVISSENQKVVGVCTMGFTKAQGQKNGAVRSEHVYETIASGVRWDPDSMGPKEPAINASVLERFNAEEYISTSGVRTDPDGAQWDLVFHSEYKPLRPGNYSWDRSEMKITSGHVKENTSIRVYVFPEDKAIDIDAFLINSSGGDVHFDKQPPDKSHFAMVQAGARAFRNLKVSNVSDQGSTPVLVIVLAKR